MTRFGNTNLRQIGNSMFLIVPIGMVRDKDFPFSDKDDLVIDIVGDVLRVSKYGTFARKR